MYKYFVRASAVKYSLKLVSTRNDLITFVFIYVSKKRLMKRFATLVFISILGGAITLGSYKLFIEKEPVVITQQQNSLPAYVPVNFTNADGEPANVDFTEAAENTVNAVVHVKNKATSTQPTNILDLFYGRGSERTRVGTGSGVIISPDGYIVTNNHVIDGAKEIEVTLNSNKTHKASLVGTDPSSDIALLKIEAGQELPFIVFGDSDATRIGEWVLAVGNPFNLTSTVTAGIISAKARDLNEFDGKNQYFLQTDAAVNPGNSGGALVNTRGELVGINTAITSQTGSYVGYSFAVPSNTTNKIIKDILEFGSVQKGLLGISTYTNSYQAKEAIGEIEGVYITDIEPESGAEIAGLKSGDIIKRLDDVKIRKFSDLSGYLSSKRPNEVVKVFVERDGRDRTFDVVLTKLNRAQFLDMEFKNMNRDDKKQYELKSGVKLASTRNAKLYKLGLVPGSFVVEINNSPIKDIDDLNSLNTSDIETIVFVNPDGERERLVFR